MARTTTSGGSDPAGGSGSGISSPPNYGPVWQLLLASTPIFALLVYFLYVAYVAQTSPCHHNSAENEEENEDGYDNYDYNNDNNGENNNNQSQECDDYRDLIAMTAVFLTVALLWAMLAVYLTVYVGRRHDLLARYLSVGRRVVGDVHYEDRKSCLGASRDHWGHLTYPHVNYGVYPVYVRRQVRVLEYYTREKVSILILPDKAFSGLPKADVKLDLALAERNAPRRTRLATIAWLWLAFAVLAPVYLMVVIDDLQEKAGMDLKASWMSWLAYALAVAVAIPALSFGVNEFVWRRYLYKMTEEGKIAEESDAVRRCGSSVSGNGRGRGGGGSGGGGLRGWFGGVRSNDESAGASYVPPDPSYSSAEDNDTMVA